MPQLPTLSMRQIPLLRLLLPFALGAAIAWWWLPQNSVPGIQFVLLAGALLLLLTGRTSQTRTHNLSWGIALHVWLLIFGWWRTTDHYQLIKADHIPQHLTPEQEDLQWTATIETVRLGAKSHRLRVAVDELGPTQATIAQPVMGKLLVYLAADSTSSSLLPGQQIRFTASVQRIESPKNPAAFDFADWQARQNVFHQVNVASGEWQLLKEEPSLRGWAYLLRERMLNILRCHLPSDSPAFAVGAALILGKKDALNTEVRNAYAETGAVHVLAVSGLHLGFIAWGLGLLFGWGPFRRQSWRWIRLVCILSGIWLFAFITGLPPSVQRAATMFSAVWIGIALGRKSSIYNTLGASAFLLLLIDPFLLFDIGFQLSYLALLGIVFFQPRIYGLLSSRWWLLDKTWALLSVALAAQLTTFPLSLYYFHQFPIYFFLSGIVVVLAATIILGLGVTLFIFSWLEPLAVLIGKLLFGALWLNNAFVFELRKLPGHLVEGIWIDPWQVVLLLVAVGLIGVYTVQSKAHYLILSLISLLLVFGVNFWHQAERRQQKRWIVYHQYKATTIDAIAGTHRYTISSLAKDDPIIRWNIEPYREKVGAVNVGTDTEDWQAAPPLYDFFDQRLVLIDREWEAKSAPTAPIEVDILVLKDAPNWRLADLSKHFQPKYWVCDGSNYPQRVKDWQAEAEQLGFKLHVTREDGAFILDF
ncbi:MAG: ComEC/Rec2 family competence protein [Bacteroidota bacterium]